jgi:hypothetical protein
VGLLPRVSYSHSPPRTKCIARVRSSGAATSRLESLSVKAPFSVVWSAWVVREFRAMAILARKPDCLVSSVLVEGSCMTARTAVRFNLHVCARLACAWPAWRTVRVCMARVAHCPCVHGSRGALSVCAWLSLLACAVARELLVDGSMPERTACTLIASRSFAQSVTTFTYGVDRITHDQHILLISGPRWCPVHRAVSTF